ALKIGFESTSQFRNLDAGTPGFFCQPFDTRNQEWLIPNLARFRPHNSMRSDSMTMSNSSNIGDSDWTGPGCQIAGSTKLALSGSMAKSDSSERTMTLGSRLPFLTVESMRH